MNDDLVINWWKEYLEADYLERGKMISKTGFLKGFVKLTKSGHELTDEQLTHLISSQLMALFEDCINTLKYKLVSKDRIKDLRDKTIKLFKPNERLDRDWIINELEELL